MKTTYNPALRKTPCGRRLYDYWKKVRRSPHSKEFDAFPDFLQWAVKSNYELGDKLVLIDDTKPYSPDNCRVKHRRCPVEERETIDEARAAEWNAVVNRIRKQFGMEPLEGTSYDDI